jgi:hypothetical protein
VSDSEQPPTVDNQGFALAPTTLGPSWQEQDGVLGDLWRQNKTPQEIAEILGRSVGAIMTRAARLGLPRRSAPGRKPGSRRNDEQGRIGGLSGGQVAARRVSTTSNKDETVTSQVSTRVCLMCLRSFQSMGRHNRICPSCKGSAEYASVTSIPDIHFPG